MVITKPRHINSRAFARVEHGDALGHLNLPSIHRHWHGIHRRRRRRQHARLHLRSRENTRHNIPSVIHASIAHRIPSRARDASSFLQFAIDREGSRAVTHRAGDARSAPRDGDQRVPGGHDYDERLCERGVRAAGRRRRRRRRVCARF